MVLASPAYQFSPFAIPSAVTAAVVTLLAISVVLTRFSRTSIALFALSVALAIWQAAAAVMDLAIETRVALNWSRIGFACASFVAPAVYQSAASLLPRARHRRIIVVAGWLIAVAIAILILATDIFISGVHRFGWGFYPVTRVTSGVLQLLFVATLLCAAMIDITRALPHTYGTEHERIRLFAIALGIGYLAVVDYLPMYGIGIYPFGWLALLTATGVIVYTIGRHGLVAITPSLAANQIISTMRDLLLVADREGRIQFANEAAYAFLGCTREDIIGRRIEELMAPADGGDSTLSGRWQRDREYVFRTKSGQPIELTLSHSPVVHGDEITGTVLIGRDLRERKRYEWEARRAITLLESTLDSTTDGILVLGEEGRVLTWNQRFVDMWGIPAELMEQDEDHDVIGHLVEQLTNASEFLRSLETFRDHPEAESFHLLELKDGRRYEQYSIGRYLGDSPLRVWSFHDVTERVTAEEALRDSEARYRLLFEQNAAGVCLATSPGRIVDCNSTFAEMVGQTTDDLKGRELRDVFARGSAAEDISRRLEETPTLRGVEIELRRRDGARVSALANISLLGRGEQALVHMTAVDISDRKRAEEQIEFQAYHDALTQLPNRRLFADRLELSLLSAKRTRKNVAVLFVDLDRFKNINDTYGHGIADALLIETSQRLRNCVRQTDTVARFGGDEFTILLPDLQDPDAAARVAEKILERVAEPATFGSTTLDISASIGVAVYPHDGAEFDTLLRSADDAMYRAKQAGRNTYQLCTEQLKTHAMERLSMQARLQKAMAADQLFLAFQPQVSITTGRITGAEALVRWNDPDRGIVEAYDFVPLAEEMRLILELGEWALLTACRQARRWRDAGLPPLRMAVNISARQFQQRDFAKAIRRVVDSCGIDASLLELEVSESAAMRHIDSSLDAFKSLRDIGVSVAIDDFGTDSSSLRSLQAFPVNAVKIDEQLVERLTTVASDAAIVAAIIDVSRTLGLRTVAEAVETREQLDFLRGRGCDEAQGFYFSAAVDAETFSRLVLDAKPLRD